MTVNIWSTTAATNATVDPTVNWRESQAPSTVNNSARAMMAAIAKWRDDLSGNIVTGGSSTAYTITTNQSLTPLVDGYTVWARMDETNGASPTLNVDSTGAKAIRVSTSTAVPTGAMPGGSVQKFTYDSSDDCWYVASFYAVTSLALAGLDIHSATELAAAPAVDDELGIYDLSATANKRITVANFFEGVTSLTAETAPAADDELLLYDTSGTSADKITLTNLFKVVDALSEDTSPDESADFLLSYDTSATAAKKVKPQNLILPGAIIAVIEDRKSSGTNAQTLADSTDNVRELNTLGFNRGSVVSLSSNRFTLPAGTWEIAWQSPTSTGNAILHQSWLYNVTDAAIEARGTVGLNDQATGMECNMDSWGRAVVTIAGSKAFEIRHRPNGDALLGGITGTLGGEIYTRVEVRAA